MRFSTPLPERDGKNFTPFKPPPGLPMRLNLRNSRLLALASFALALPALHANQIAASQEGWIERYEKQKEIVSPEAAQLNTDLEPDLSAEGFVSLYNGKNLDGWTPLGGDCTFEAQGEVIVGTCVPGSPSTYLSTDRADFADFIFTAELKWAVDGNSGIMFRAQQRGDDKVTVYGPQCEMEGFSTTLKGSSALRGWSGGIYGQSDGGWRYPLWLEGHEAARRALKPGAWNRITIEAVGDTVKTWVNGVPAAHWVDATYRKGFFGLQVHSGKQGEIHFRNIKVKELNRHWEDLLGSNDLSAWSTIKGDPVSAGWSLRDGIVHRSGLKPGNIITRRHYRDFELAFSWKISPGGNSGVKYRTRGKLGLEYQILDDERHRDGHDPRRQASSLYDLFAAPEDKPLAPVGSWNHARIIAQGDRVEHWLNGVKVLSATIGSEEWNERFQASKYRDLEAFGTGAGPILLQDHNDEVWYRNIRIREL